MFRDIRRVTVLGRCEARTGIVPFDQPLDDMLSSPAYPEEGRLFIIADNGSPHGGAASIQRVRKRENRVILIHTPIHASLLDHIEIYFSIFQWKALTPNDFSKVVAESARLALYEYLTDQTLKPFVWSFTLRQLATRLERITQHLAADADS
jgi:hypothetical protein